MYMQQCSARLDGRILVQYVFCKVGRAVSPGIAHNNLRALCVGALCVCVCMRVYACMCVGGWVCRYSFPLPAMPSRRRASETTYTASLYVELVHSTALHCTYTPIHYSPLHLLYIGIYIYIPPGRSACMLFSLLLCSARLRCTREYIILYPGYARTEYFPPTNLRQRVHQPVFGLAGGRRW